MNKVQGLFIILVSIVSLLIDIGIPTISYAILKKSFSKILEKQDDYYDNIPKYFTILSKLNKNLFTYFIIIVIFNIIETIINIVSLMK